MEEVLKMTKEKDPPILVKFGPQSDEYYIGIVGFGLRFMIIKVFALVHTLQKRKIK